MKQGANWMPDPEATFPSTFYTCSGASQTAAVPEGADPAAFDRYRCNAGEIKEFNVLAYDREVFGNEWFTTGHAQSYGADVSGGSDQVTYYMSADWDRDEGFLPYNWRNHLSGRANISYVPSDAYRFDFSLNQNRIKAQAASAQQPLSTAVIWACPDPGCEAEAASDPTLPGRTAATSRTCPRPTPTRSRASRTWTAPRSASQGRHDPFDWLTHRLSAGGDFSNISELGALQGHGEHRTVPVPWPEVDHQSPEHVRLVRLRGDRDYGLSDDINFTTSGGVQFLPAPGGVQPIRRRVLPHRSPHNGKLGVGPPGRGDFLENRTFGVFVQEQSTGGTGSTSREPSAAMTTAPSGRTSTSSCTRSSPCRGCPPMRISWPTSAGSAP